jgi:hypothetical protein
VTADSVSSCARAATAEEARYRIDRPIPGRTACVVALDTGAAEILERSGRPFTRAPAPNELAGADLVLVVATNDDGAELAADVARSCWELGVMTTGLIVGESTDAVAALRPYARNLMVTEDEDDVTAVLTALRA